MTQENVHQAILNAAEILSDNADSLSQDILTRKVNDITVWIRFDPDSVPTIDICKTYSLF